MRSNPVGRIVRNLLEAERKEKERREWLKNLFVPVGHELFGCYEEREPPGSHLVREAPDSHTQTNLCASRTPGKRELKESKETELSKEN